MSDERMPVVGFVLIGFLLINNLVADKAHAEDPKFRRFGVANYFIYLYQRYSALRPGMETPELAQVLAAT